jgi:hypothetical protein
VLGDGEGTVGIAGEQHPLGQFGGRAQMDRAGLVYESHAAGEPYPRAVERVWDTPRPMAKRPTTPTELRDAVERTVQATLGSAERQRERTQGALDDLAGTVDQLRRGAEAGLARGRRAIEDRRPATSEDIRDLKAELRRLGRRLDAIEERLPAKRSGSGAAKRSGGAAKRSGGGAKRSGGRRTS